ncbi:D-alanine--D-alanine ligase family protein [Thermoflavimicrobium dichotomicum]|uniref:D-alanine-D-alanine ligase n=1 Tax=Thermoflavimicrobium dichotomicum TaxID=46223 RepID=A0A1I3U3G5_9BACL|nr:ATP-grasp domain-containing protein [Thermoflavimicrobium dichotomicum]SFJ77455.1 D-alanine-D-alanine ligase [Thermoflavimicrobium dichotomicum]
MKISVIYGGSPMEYDIALKTAKFVHEELISLGHEVFLLDMKNIFEEINMLKKMDFAFLVTYGCPGEDGTLQGLLELLDIPYNGSGVLASSLFKDKSVAKHIFQSLKIPTPQFMSFTIHEYYSNKKEILDQLSRSLSMPVIFKPAVQGGSSIGIKKVSEFNINKINKAIQHVNQYDDKILVENYINGVDYIIGAVCDVNEITLLPLMRAVVNKENSFKSRYLSNKPMFVENDELDNKIVHEICSDMVKALELLNVRGFCYADLRVDSKEQYYFIEIGTTYGMLPNSVVPVSASKVGLDIKDVLNRDIEIGLKRHKQKRGSKVCNLH